MKKILENYNIASGNTSISLVIPYEVIGMAIQIDSVGLDAGVTVNLKQSLNNSTSVLLPGGAISVASGTDTNIVNIANPYTSADFLIIELDVLTATAGTISIIYNTQNA